MFRDLRVVGLGSSASYIPTLGSMFNPMSILEAIQNARHPPLRDILSGFEGAIRPGEMLCTSSACNLCVRSLLTGGTQWFWGCRVLAAPRY
jgi:hypothetical protein